MFIEGTYCAYVTYPDKLSATTAFNYYNNKPLDGKKLRIHFMEPCLAAPKESDQSAHVAPDVTAAALPPRSWATVACDATKPPSPEGAGGVKPPRRAPMRAPLNGERERGLARVCLVCVPAGP